MKTSVLTHPHTRDLRKKQTNKTKKKIRQSASSPYGATIAGCFAYFNLTSPHTFRPNWFRLKLAIHRHIRVVMHANCLHQSFLYRLPIKKTNRMQLCSALMFAYDSCQIIQNCVRSTDSGSTNPRLTFHNPESTNECMPFKCKHSCHNPLLDYCWPLPVRWTCCLPSIVSNSSAIRKTTMLWRHVRCSRQFSCRYLSTQMNCKRCEFREYCTPDCMWSLCQSVCQSHPASGCSIWWWHFCCKIHRNENYCDTFCSRCRDRWRPLCCWWSDWSWCRAKCSEVVFGWLRRRPALALIRSHWYYY